MRAAAGLLALLLIIGGAGYYFSAVKPIDDFMVKGLDIRGGVRLVLEAVETPEVPEIAPERMDRAMEIVRYRVDKLGVSEPSIQLEGRRRIIVELAGVEDPEEAAKILGTTAQLKFVAPSEAGEVARGEVVVTGEHLDRASVSQTGSEYIVDLQLKGEGIDRFADATQKYLGQQIAIVLDDEIYSAPVVQGIIPGGQAQITGGWFGDEGGKEAKALADILNGGALPVKLNIIENRTVSATLGEDSFNRSLYAGLLGLAFTVAFMLVLYRAPGIMAIMALAVYMFLTLAALIIMGATLTLPGIAGIILSIGMAVDANVLIFERCKEELRAGKSLRGGVQAGFHRALNAVIDSNLTTILAAIILYYTGTGPVKGFGLTLGTGVVISMFTAITLSRWLVQLLIATGWFSRRTLFGLREEVQA